MAVDAIISGAKFKAVQFAYRDLTNNFRPPAHAGGSDLLIL
jgi:hypothetical protein